MRYIQKILGHNSSKTLKQAYRLTGQATEIYPIEYSSYGVYTHTISNGMNKIKSPLDDMNFEGDK